MNDLMTRQREQLRSLQVMLKPEDDPNGGMNGQGGGAAGQGNNPNNMEMNQQQLAQVTMNFRMQPQRQSQNNMQMPQAQGLGQNFFQGNQGQQQQQQQPTPVQSQQPQMQQLQQLQQQAQQQQNQSQQRVSSAVMEHMIRQRQKQGPGNEPQKQQLQRKRSQEHPVGNQSKALKLNQSQPSPPISSQDQASLSAAANNTRVVPVALSPRYPKGSQHGDISEAALIYTKHALNSIVTSLNSNNSGAREYTIRDLSTCLGAWDLSHPSSKRQKQDESNPNINDGNADTAFNFYYERSCPILLDAKRPTGSIPFSVEDFGEGESPDEGLPALTGAVVLTFGADKKFTGGIGEEGGLTKGKDWDGTDVEMNVLAEAEEQLFARVDNEQSSFIKAALHALSPKLAGGDEEKAYVPTIWSGNTNRVYQYCLLGNFDDEGKELSSKRLCVAIQKKNPSTCGDGPSKGVCRITVTLSPTSVLAEKKKMANERDGQNLNEASSAIHRKIRQNLRCLRPPKLVSPSSLDDNMMGSGKRRVNLRRPSMTHLIDPSLIVVGMRCKHQLLLDAEEIGKVYINGSLIVDCSRPRASSDDKPSVRSNTLSALGALSPDVLPAHTLFGIDFTFPTCNEAMFFRDLPNKATLQQEYGALLVDALIDATQFESDVAGKLLCRLLTGKIENTDDDDQDDEEKDRKGHSRVSSKSSFYDDEINSTPSSKISFDDVSKHCIESMVLSSSVSDPVGIGAKALSTKFRMHYGKHHFPCEVGTDEEYRLRKTLGPKKVAQSVPRRVRDILCRGGYLPLDKMATFIWKGSGASWEGDHNDSMRASEAMEGAIQLLLKAGCNNVKPNMIRFVGRKQLEIADSSVSSLRCWYDAPSETYFVNDSILFVDHRGSGVSDEQSEAPKSKTCEAGAMKTNDGDTLKSPTNRNEPSESIEEQPHIDGGGSSECAVQNEEKVTFNVVKEERNVKDHEEQLEEDDINGQVAKRSKGETGTEEPSIEVTPEIDLEETKDESNNAIKTERDNDVINDNSTPSDDANDKDHTSVTPSEQTEIATNSCTEKETTDPKPSYRPTEEIAYLVALSIAREHPNPMLLESFVICHSS
jgi:hypothetical protein